MVMGSKKSKPKPNSKYGENTSGSSGSQTGESERKVFGSRSLMGSSGYLSFVPIQRNERLFATRHIHDIVLKKTKLSFVRELGEGSFGKVIAVTHPDTKSYAVKIMRTNVSEVREKYQARELKLLTEQVDSPIMHGNIVRYYDSWKCDESFLCIRMELCDTSLENLLKSKRGSVDTASFYRHVFPQILSGLKYIHDKNWVHRDLYPANILMKIPYVTVMESWVVKLADFGLARKLEPQPSLTHSDPPEEVLSVVGHKQTNYTEHQKCLASNMILKLNTRKHQKCVASHMIIKLTCTVQGLFFIACAVISKTKMKS